MNIGKQLNAMARVARVQGDMEIAADLARVAMWAHKFKGWNASPFIGPRGPAIACEHARVTGEALARAFGRSIANHRAMVAAFHGEAHP